ncbi:hypothetical protein LUZ60_004536 [Juncus effusus]|nr:hypothetical protein LUZ60_004536 [Juncus effusus]
MAASAALHPSRFFASPRVGKSFFRQQNLRKNPIKVYAIFWGPKKASQSLVLSPSLGPYTLTVSSSEVQNPQIEKVSVSVLSSILEISQNDWDLCANDPTGEEEFNPFLSYAFLSSLEETRCSVKETGWIPQHIVARDQNENILGVVPLYLKSHSYGEFVFDHSWADAYYNYGYNYYPKLQCSVPFTPVTGQRILVRNLPFKDQVFDVLVEALKDLTAKFEISSLHITFPSETEWHKLKNKGFLQRIGMQYHWRNRNYQHFDDFLMDLKQSKRKNIRQERKKIPAQNLKMKRLQGDDITAKHWDSFYSFYRNTTDNKWGRVFLTREFFHTIGERLGDKVMLITAEQDDQLVAGALNLVGGDTLFGRLWGCLPDSYFPNLHFEACYYQAIEAAIELKLSKVEAGAQGEHKIQRGYLPVTTYSSHYIMDEGFRKAIDSFLLNETVQMKHVMKVLCESGPFKEEIMKEHQFD